jgi:hypothetical protein
LRQGHHQIRDLERDIVCIEQKRRLDPQIPRHIRPPNSAKLLVILVAEGKQARRGQQKYGYEILPDDIHDVISGGAFSRMLRRMTNIICRALFNINA